MNTTQLPAYQCMASPADNTMLQYIQQDFPRALDKFYLAHRNEFFKWSEKSFGLGKEQAADIYQDSIIILYENIKQGKFSCQNASMKTYLFAIGKNLIHSYIRQRQRDLDNRHKLHDESIETGDHMALLSDATPCQTALNELPDAIRQIPERGQHLIRLFYFDKKPIKQIAAVLGYRNEDVVKSTKLRYLRSLRNILQEKMIQSMA